MSSRPSHSTPAKYQNYTWVDGFKDFFVFVKENFLFTITFIVFHSFIAYTLVASFNKRMEPIQQEICPNLKNQTHYYDGVHWNLKPEGDLESIYNRIIGQVRSHRSLFVEDLLAIASPASLEQAEAAIELKGEYFIHKYRAVIPCQPEIKSNDGLLTVALIYLVAFAIYLVYLTSPYGKKY